MGKLKVGIFSFTACEGCQIVMINSEELFGDAFKDVDLAHLPIIQEHNDDGPYDAVFVEGAITHPTQVKRLVELREKASYLVAFGTCATFGGVSAMRNFKEKEIDEGKPANALLEVLDVKSISKYVKVDYQLRGCPPVKEEFIKVIDALKKKKEPEVYNKSVCVECRANKNPCLLIKGEQCLGPVTAGGCDALCTGKGIACYGCRGPVDQANVDGLVSLFRSRGLTNRQIREMFMIFAGTSKRYEEFVKRAWQKK